MYINLKQGEMISQNKLDVLQIASELGQITIEIDLMECKANYSGNASAFHTYNMQYMVKYVTKNYIHLQQFATYQCGDSLQICKYYCAVSNGFGYTEAKPHEIQDYEYVIVPNTFIVEL